MLLSSSSSLTYYCISVISLYVDQLNDEQLLNWSKIPLKDNIITELVNDNLNLNEWIVVITLFTNIPIKLCSFSSSTLPLYSHLFLTVLSVPSSNHLTFSTLKNIPNLAALDASSTSLPSLPVLHFLRVLYLRNCPQITDHVLTKLLSFPLLSVIDITRTKCSPTHLRIPFTPSTINDLFQPSIQASLTALAALYPNIDAFPSPLFTLNYLLPRPPPPPPPRLAIQDSFVVFSSSSTKFGNTNSLVFHEEHPDSSPYPPKTRHSFPLPSRPSQTHPTTPLPSLPSPFCLHRPPPPLSVLHHPPAAPNFKPSPSNTYASLNLHNQKALLARKGLDAFTKLRSTPPTPTIPNPLPPSTSTSSSKKNPFKKPSLRPISSIPPPILPPALIPNPTTPLPRKKPKVASQSSPRIKPLKRASTSSFDWKAWSSASSTGT